MKITCELTSRANGKRITSIEIKDVDFGGFGANMDNPFPASELVGVFFNSKSAIVTYCVAQAWGEA